MRSTKSDLLGGELKVVIVKVKIKHIFLWLIANQFRENECFDIPKGL